MLTLTAAVVGWIVFVASGHPLSFLTIPLCVWAGFRFGQREAATVTCALSFFAAWGSAQGLGTFAQGSPNDSVLVVEAFMAVTSIVGLTSARPHPNAGRRKKVSAGLTLNWQRA